MAVFKRFTSPNKDCQVLKLSSTPNVLLQSQSNDQQALIPLRASPITIEADIWASFNNLSDGIRIIGRLVKNKTIPVAIGSCTFKVYLVSESDWTETLLWEGAGVPQNNYFYKNLSESDLLNTELIGERTLRIEATFLRATKRYRKSIYLNHLGIFDYALRTKQRVDFLEIEVL